MLTLNEAIRHCEEKACGNTECAEEYGQLAKWLRELKVRREDDTGPNIMPPSECRRPGELSPFQMVVKILNSDGKENVKGFELKH